MIAIGTATRINDDCFPVAIRPATVAIRPARIPHVRMSQRRR
jgi:hypothetical protein